MSQKEQELEAKFKQTLVGMLDDEASSADTQQLLSEANRPAVLSVWRRYQRQSAVLSGSAWLSDDASTDFLERLNRRLAEEMSGAEAPAATDAGPAVVAGTNVSGRAVFSWFGDFRSWAVAASVAAVAVLTLSLTLNYSPTRNIEPISALADNADYTVRDRRSADFVRRRVSAYTLNHANNRVVSTHFVPFTKMSTYKTSWSGQGRHSVGERNAPVQYRKH